MFDSLSIILEEGPTACQRGEGGAEPKSSSCLRDGGNVFDLAEHISEHPPRSVTHDMWVILRASSVFAVGLSLGVL